MGKSLSLRLPGRHDPASRSSLQADRDEAVLSDGDEVEASRSLRGEGSDDEGEDLLDNAEA